jgi:DNA-directed RNA polymerase specialized sigma24 family protein
MGRVFKVRVWGRDRKGMNESRAREGEGAVFLGLSRREFRKRSGRALARMTPLQRDILRDLASEDATYEQLALRNGITVDEVAAQFGAGLLILADAFEETRPWWRRPWRR